MNDPMKLIDEIAGKMLKLAESLNDAYPPGTPLDRESVLYKNAQAELKQYQAVLQEAVDRTTKEGAAELEALSKPPAAAPAAPAAGPVPPRGVAVPGGAVGARGQAPADGPFTIQFADTHSPDGKVLEQLLNRLSARAAEK
jgi:hypothetical protein